MSGTIKNQLFKTTNSKETTEILENFDKIIQNVRPLNSRQLQQLPDNIKALSHQLTDERASRRLGYMNETQQLSAYVRYYTWWNLVRLTRLFANLPAKSFPTQKEQSVQSDKSDKSDKSAASDTSEKIVCLDLGSGPLTVILALWIARPELRSKKLIWYCLDVSANSMALGEDLYLSLAAQTGEEPWKIIRVKGSFGTVIRQKADFITCANMFNELDQASTMPPEFQSKKYYDQLMKYASPSASLLLIEPGVPKAARTLSLLRDRFIRAGFTINAPCPHAEECPMNGFKAYTGSTNKWCNFAFSTENAPVRLQKLSESAKLPKERATLSFISVSKLADSSDSQGDSIDRPSNNNRSKSEETLFCRITSDAFRLPGNKTGFYACSKLGLVLLKTNAEMQNNKSDDIKHKSAEKKSAASNTSASHASYGSTSYTSGDLIEVKIKTPETLPRDKKSGAPVICI